ncbi:MAG: helix-turn-helix transcriptional regulator [Bacteroidota bacterium]
MDISKQVLFSLSVIGGLNGLMLSLYFVLATKRDKVSGYFLSALLFVISIRVLKSVFLYFNPNLSGTFIQIGLSACALIGPFLFLYVKSWRYPKIKTNWLFHIVPITIIIIGLGILYPYVEYRRLWARYIVKLIYLVWLLYIVFSGVQISPLFSKLLAKSQRLESIEIWLISLFTGISIIWLGYNLGAYTSYIVGAVSSSFVFFLLLLFWILKRRNTGPFFEEHIKYGDKKIDEFEAKEIIDKLDHLLAEEKLFKDADLKIADVAKRLRISPHYLSQLLNDNAGRSFSSHINIYRIEEAKSLLIKDKHFTTEAVGYQCGFNSKSTFFSVFKKITGLTPASYRAGNQ